MKYLSIIIIFFILNINNSFSQIEKGKFLIGGSFVKVSNSAYNTTIFTPKFGYMIDNEFMGGLAIESAAGETSLMPFGRYYKPLNDKTFAFGEFGFNLSNKGKLQASVGINYFIKENVTLEPTISFTRSNEGEKGFKEIHSSVKLGIGLQFFF